MMSTLYSSKKFAGRLASLVIGFMILNLLMAGDASAKKVEIPDVGDVNFGGAGESLDIDNLYMPLVPGTTFYYEAETDEGLETNITVVTSDTYMVQGITTRVVWDRAYLEGLLFEETLDWYAQDVDGNVWYFGEDTESYEYDDEGKLIGSSTEGSWEAGADVAGIGSNAEAGIVMLADPKQGLSYSQEYYEDEAEDMGAVLKLNSTVSIEYDDFDECLETKEWTPIEPGHVEHKYYAPGVGLVYVEELKEKTVYVELVDITYTP